MRADCADETVPAVCYGGVVEEGEIEWDEGPRSTAGGDAVVDWFVGFCLGFFGGIGDAHLCGAGRVL